MSTPTVPTPPTTATTTQVAAHHSLLQTAIAALEALPQNVANAEAYLNLQSLAVANWVTAKHVKTRIIEVALLAATVGFVVGVIVARVF